MSVGEVFVAKDNKQNQASNKIQYAFYRYFSKHDITRFPES